MIKVSVLTILVLQLLGMLVEISGQSDCSQYFKYITKSLKNEIWGEISIPSPPRNVRLHLKVGLSIAVRLSNTSYFGQIQLAQSKEDSILEVQQGRPLLYYIRFPSQQPIPVVTGIWLNNQLYCTGPHASTVLGSPVSLYVLEHSLHLSQILDQNKDECGRSFTNITINQFVSTKVKISPGEWPWLVAIFHARELIIYKCVGTLLTNRHVLTVASCVKNETENVLPAQLIASLGRYQLSNWQEKGSVNKLIESYAIHPEYQSPKDNNFKNLISDSGLAILVMSTPVAYSSNIKPICLWSGPSDLQRVVDKSGYVVRWGMNDLRNGSITEEPQMSRAPIVSQEDCIRNSALLLHLTSKRTFCAGLRSSSDPYNGDFGSGLMLYNATTGRYELRGVVAATFVYKKTDICEVDLYGDFATTITYTDILYCTGELYVLYIDVAKHMDWINQQISIK